MLHYKERKFENSIAMMKKNLTHTMINWTNGIFGQVASRFKMALFWLMYIFEMIGQNVEISWEEFGFR